MAATSRRARVFAVAFSLIAASFVFARASEPAQAATGTLTYGPGAHGYTVPANTTKLLLKVSGAAGGAGHFTSNNSRPGGRGGYVQGDLPVTPGQSLFIHVGGVGETPGYFRCNGGAGGTNGGGVGGNGGINGAFGECLLAPGGGGGGGSDVRLGTDDHAGIVLAAGGGGGAGGDASNASNFQNPLGAGGIGDGGNPGGNGQNGTTGSSCTNSGGKAGIGATSGGAGPAGARGASCGTGNGEGSDGTSGAALQGGAGGNSQVANTRGGGGGGGGSGYYGGGGAGAGTSGRGAGGGGGGASFIAGNVQNTMRTPDVRSGNGEIILIPYCNAPQSPNVTAGTNTLDVSWTVPTNGAACLPSTYTVTAVPDAGPTIVKTVTGAPAATSTQLGGLSPDSLYSISVTATNDAGTTAPSPTVSAPAPLSRAPDAPSDVNAIPGDGAAQVTWTAPTYTGDSALASYTVIATPGGATQTVTGSPPDTTVTFGGLTEGSTYTFSVRATNTSGRTSELSSPSDPVTLAVPDGFSVSDVTTAEGTGRIPTKFVFAVTRAGDLSLPAKVRITATSGSATLNRDFKAIPKTKRVVRFAAGQIFKTVVVRVVADRLIESDETFTVSLSNPTGSVIVDGTATGTITNDD